jgi:hypothetical protein
VTLQAIGVNGGGASPAVTATYSILQTPAVPTFSPAPGVFANAQSIAITSPGATSMYFTTDGSTPTSSSTLYSGPISVPASATLQAIGVNDFGSSDVGTGMFTILPAIAAPVFSSTPEGQAVAIASTTNGATIRYTIDGSVPTETNGTIYDGPVSITGPTTLKAIAYVSGIGDSGVTSATIGIPTITITSPNNGSTIP